MIGTVGKRLDLRGMKLIQRTWYEKELGYKHEARRIVVWRYCFTLGDECIVYSGKWLSIPDGVDTVDIRATIKRHDETWGLTRIRNPIILEPQLEQGKLI